MDVAGGVGQPCVDLLCAKRLAGSTSLDLCKNAPGESPLSRGLLWLPDKEAEAQRSQPSQGHTAGDLGKQ